MKSAYSLLIVIALLALSCSAFAEPLSYTIDPEHTVFAIVTHKAGIAARLAHNHFIAPTKYDCEIRQDSDTLESLSFTLEFPVTELAADRPELQKKWFPEIKAAGILATPFSEIDESDRATIEEHMLAKGQLDAEQFPKIKAELVSLSSIQSIPSIESNHGDKTFEYAATIQFTVHGKAVERAMPANVTVSEGNLTVEALDRFRFTDFDIEPYSTFLGAVKNKNEFDVYVHIQAKAEKSTAPRK